MMPPEEVLAVRWKALAAAEGHRKLHPVKPNKATGPRGPKKAEPRKVVNVRSIKSIIEEVCEATGFTAKQLTGPVRTHPIVTHRQDAMLMAWRAGHKHGPIGRAFNRDHATVYYSIRQAMARALDEVER